MNVTSVYKYLGKLLLNLLAASPQLQYGMITWNHCLRA